MNRKDLPRHTDRRIRVPWEVFLHEETAPLGLLRRFFALFLLYGGLRSLLF